MLTKLIASPLVAAAWLIAAHIVVRAVDSSGYAAYMLVAGIATLLPFADLGLGAAVMDAFSRRGTPNGPDPHLVLVTTWRVLVKAGLVLAGVGLSIGLLQGWTVVLGIPHTYSTNLAISACVALFAFGLPVSIGPRILTGLERNHWAVGFQALSAVIMVVLVMLISYIAPRIELFILAPYIGTVVSNCFALLAGSRLAGLRINEIAFLIYGKGRVSGAVVRHVAGPMLAISVVLPLAYQLDRIVLSHFAELSDVAEYSLGYQVFSPMLGVIGSAGVALWPVFARYRLGPVGLERRSVLISELAFTSVGVLMAAVVFFGAPAIASIVADDAIVVSPQLSASFALLLVIQAASYPLAMVLTDPKELKLQAGLHILMLMVNLPLSIWLATLLGASGPVVGSIAAILVALFIPQCVRVSKVTVRAVNGG